MALIKCPECGRDVSNNDDFCPNCGFKISQWEHDSKKQEYSALSIASFIGSLLSLILFFIGIGFWIALPSLAAGIISISRPKDGKSFAIAAIVLSAITIIIAVMFFCGIRNVFL